ncbi:MAG: LamG-like jellyroll fold domain-containing protein [Pseudomonadota bacterium]
MRDVVVGAAMKSTLTSIRLSRESLDNTSARLASGNRVNTALDNPRNFFQAAELNFTASNFSSLLDNMNLGVRTIQQAIAGVEQLENILNIAEFKAIEARATLEQTSSALPNFILEEEPIGYFQLNDAEESPTAENLGNAGAILADGVYTNGVRAGEEILFYGAGGLPARFDGTNQFVEVPVDPLINLGGPFPERTVELIFNADSTTGRQVLWEEGGNVNSLNIYIDDGLLRVNGRTTAGGGYGPIDISVPIEVGTTYHVAFTQLGGSPTVDGQFIGYLNGERIGNPVTINGTIGNHPNRNAIGGIAQNVYFHDDGPGNAPARADGTFAFNGQISDVAIYNRVLDQEAIAARYTATSLPLSEEFRADIQDFLGQLGDFVEDTSYQGINLLNREDLIVNFDDENESKLRIDGQRFSLEDLGLDNINFQKPSQTRDSVIAIQDAIEKVREFGRKLANDLAIIQTRQDFTRNFVNNYRSGATDLTIADQNAEGANLLAQQTRLALGTEALSLASESSRSILEIFGTGSNLFGN